MVESTIQMRIDLATRASARRTRDRHALQDLEGWERLRMWEDAEYEEVPSFWEQEEVEVVIFANHSAPRDHSHYEETVASAQEVVDWISYQEARIMEKWNKGEKLTISEEIYVTKQKHRLFANSFSCAT